MLKKIIYKLKNKKIKQKAEVLSFLNNQLSNSYIKKYNKIFNKNYNERKIKLAKLSKNKRLFTEKEYDEILDNILK